MAGSIPEESLALIQRWEGLHKVKGGMVHPYPDVAHGWKVTTQGYGTTIDPETRRKLHRRSRVITKVKAKEWLALDLQRKYLPGADRSITRKLHPLSRGAVASFVYNVGVGAFCRSTLRKRINEGDLKGVAREWRKWCMAGGRVYRGLVMRREAELAMFLEGERLLAAGEGGRVKHVAPKCEDRSVWRLLLRWVLGRRKP